MFVFVVVLFIVLFFFFFLMIRRPPRSTLFPTRRSSDLGAIGLARTDPHDRRRAGETGQEVAGSRQRQGCGNRAVVGCRTLAPAGTLPLRWSAVKPRIGLRLCPAGGLQKGGLWLVELTNAQRQAHGRTRVLKTLFVAVLCFGVVVAGAAAEVALRPRQLPVPAQPIKAAAAIQPLTQPQLETILAKVAKSLDEPLRERLSDAILTESTRAGFDPLFVLALVAVESRFRPQVSSEAGASGLMQLRSEEHTSELQ